MTTNVYDVDSTVVATDSRWSQSFNYRGSLFIRYVDDSNFEKIEFVRDQVVLAFAGYAHLVQDWKTYLRSNPQATTPLPKYQGMSVCWVDAPTRRVAFSAGDGKLRDCGSYFAGSGSIFALSAWQLKKDARQAVEYAKKHDHLSGGSVKFFDVTQGTHNLPFQADVSASKLDALLRDHGTIVQINMKPNNPVPESVSPLAANSELYERVTSGLADGSIRPSAASAPFEGIDDDWSPEQKGRFTAALSKLFGW